MSDEGEEINEAKELVEELVEYFSNLPLTEQVEELRKSARLYRMSASILDIMVDNKKQELSVRKLH